MILGELIQAWREKKGLTLDQVGAKVGVGPLVIWRLEQGKYRNCKHWPEILRWVFGK